MGISLNSNVAAFQAHSRLLKVQGEMQESITRLSSGLRINGAADDPSGLAISQRLHTQLSGLNRASLNVQDSISYLQTAEFSLGETQVILQRMRELAVQASNGTLTATDRGEIQKEVTQLIAEVDRIALSTEYNTKKLLDGSASALWSASSDNVNVVVRGSVAEGNYELEIDTDPVANNVLKTDIFSLKADAIGVDNVDLNASNAQLQFQIAGGTTANSGTLTFDFGTGVTYDLAVDAGVAASDLATNINQNEDLQDYVTAYVVTSGANTFINIEADVDGTEGNVYSLYANTGNVGGVTTTAVYTFSGGDDYPTGVQNVGAPTGIPSSMGTTEKYEIHVDNEVAINAGGDTAHVVAAYEQGIGGDITAASTQGSLANYVSVAAGDTVAQTGSGYAIVEITQGGVVDGAGTNAIFAKASMDNGNTWYNLGNIDTGANVTIQGDDVSLTLNALNAGDTINTGDKVLIALNDEDFNNATHAEVQVVSPFPNSLGGNTQNGPTYSFVSDSLNKRATRLTVGNLDIETGDVTFGEIEMSVDILKSTSATNSAIATDGGVSQVTFDVIGGGGTAFNSTKLYQIDKFYDNNGNFILGENGKSITIYNAEGDRADIFIDPEDTIGEVSDKIENAIVSSKQDGGLGMGTGNETIDSHVADYVTESTPFSDEAVKGTIVIRSPQMGTRGKIYFSADEGVLNALSLAEIQSPDLDPMTVTVRDAHTGKMIGEDTVADAVLRNVVQGVDIELNPNLDVDISWDAAHKKYVFSNSVGTVKEYVHIVDNAKSFQIGANVGQTMDSYIGEMTAGALGIEKVMVVTQDLAQGSIRKLDNAIDMVSSERARLGAIINRLGHTANNLEVQSANAFASESRIKDLDMAEETTEFSKQQILSQVATSMIAQANKLPQNLLGLLR